MYIHSVTKKEDKSNNFFKQNEKLNITKNLFRWHLGDSSRAQFNISPISYSWSEVLHANIALSILTNAASIAVLNDVTLGCRDLLVTFSTTLHT